MRPDPLWNPDPYAKPEPRVRTTLEELSSEYAELRTAIDQVVLVKDPWYVEVIINGQRISVAYEDIFPALCARYEELRTAILIELER